MIIIITLKEARKKCNWVEFCDMFGWNPYCINEGIDPTTTQTMTEEQAEKLGFSERFIKCHEII